MGRLAGKRAFVTAAGQGIGAATVRAFAAEGAHVIATDLSGAALEALAGEVPGIETAVLDARDTDAVDRAASGAGRVDVLFNCAGFVHHGTILDCDEAAWDFSFDLNVKSMWRTVRAFLPAMLEAGGGSIIN
ncbi:MAG: SDR family NAD(P)-dependent oxidoreductase, partial [Pseudomonadota bacterium]